MSKVQKLDSKHLRVVLSSFYIESQTLPCYQEHFRSVFAAYARGVPFEQSHGTESGPRVSMIAAKFKSSAGQ